MARPLAAGLIGRALAAYRDAGLSTASVEVCSSNVRAVGLYTKLGFAASDPGYTIMYAPVPA